MARITKLLVEGFRSVRDPIEIRFPQNIPIVLVGENNAGKSNIIRAVDLLLGEWWPGTHNPEDHEFWDRNPDNGPITIRAAFDGMTGYNQSVEEIYWTARADGEPVFKCVFRNGNEKYVNKEMRDQLTPDGNSGHETLSHAATCLA